MAYPNIYNLKYATIESADYFADANVWIYSLQNWANLKPWEDKYYQFFFDIVDSTLDPKPKLLLPTLLVSEITNTYLKKFAVPDFFLQNSIPQGTAFDFKKQYRPTQHYKDSFEKIMDDISSLHSTIKYVDDRCIANAATLLNKSIGIFDYNDYLYYNLCKELNKTKRTIMLTNDGDFQVSDFEIVTLNKTLLSL